MHGKCQAAVTEHCQAYPIINLLKNKLAYLKTMLLSIAGLHQDSMRQKIQYPILKVEENDGDIL